MGLLKAVYLEEKFDTHDSGYGVFAFLEFGIIIAGLAFAISFFNRSLSMTLLWVDIAYFGLIIILISFINDPVYDFDPFIALISFNSIGGLIYFIVNNVNPSGAKKIIFFLVVADLIVLIIFLLQKIFSRKESF